MRSRALCCKNSSVSSVCSVVTVLLLTAACARTPTAPSSNTPAVSAPTVRVLMVSTTYGFRHDSITTAAEVMPVIGRSSGLLFTTTEDLSAISASNLSTFDVLMFANTTGELPLTSDQKQAVLSFVSDGHGFVGTHSATDTLREWADYGRLVGAYMVDHPWTQPARVLVEDAAHPAIGIRDPFTLEEEFYVFGTNPRSRVQVLLRLDAASVSATGDYPLAWAQSFGSGRSYYNALGHFPATWRDSRYQAQLIAGLRWAANK
jgi:type 1 glutamine amidotransferase